MAAMIISYQLFEAYLFCPLKCWLRSRAEPIAGNKYAEWTGARKEAYHHKEGVKRAFAPFAESARANPAIISNNFRDAMWRFATDVRLRTRDLESRLLAVEKVPSKGRGRPIQFIPYHFAGKIIHGDAYATRNVKLPSLTSQVQKGIKGITALLAADSPPELLLNRHCGECEFQARCRRRATEKDELSLLSGMTEKDRKGLHAKGIFTVTQLSYLFRPRRRRRGSQHKPEKFHHSASWHSGHQSAKRWRCWQCCPWQLRFESMR
jgi:hypothetical protein